MKFIKKNVWILLPVWIALGFILAPLAAILFIPLIFILQMGEKY